MRVTRGKICVLFAAAVFLVLYGCSNTIEEAPSSSSETAENELTMTASFQREDGSALRGSTACFSFEEGSVDRPLDDNGELKISGLPRSGDMTLIVLDRQEYEQGSMVLSVSEGAVIDAATDEDGVGHITLRRDTEEVALYFTLRDDGSLLCDLRLAHGNEQSQEAEQREI